MSNDLQVANQFEIVVTPEQKELVKQTVFPDATDAELQLFFFDCTRRGIHPLDKLIHPTKRNGKYTPITSIDLFRQRASDSGEHMGTDDAVYTSAPANPDFAASVTVYKHLRGEKCAFTATARWSEYCPQAGSDFMWKKMPHLMLAKCAEALALRKAFPAQLHGLYTPEEMAQAEPANIAPKKMMPGPVVYIPETRPKQDATVVRAATDRYTGGVLSEGTARGIEQEERQEDGPTAPEAGSPVSGDAPAPLSAKAFCEEQAAKAETNEHEAEGYIGTYTPRLAGKQSPPGRFVLETMKGELTLQFWETPAGMGTPNHSYAKVTYRQSERAGKGGKVFTNNELLFLQWTNPPA